MMILVGIAWIVAIIVLAVITGNAHITQCRTTLVAQRQSAGFYTPRDAGLNPVEGARSDPNSEG